MIFLLWLVIKNEGRFRSALAFRAELSTARIVSPDSASSRRRLISASPRPASFSTSAEVTQLYRTRSSCHHCRVSC